MRRMTNPQIYKNDNLYCVSYDAVSVYSEIMKDMEDENKENLRKCIDQWEEDRKKLTAMQWEEMTMRKTDKMDILLMLRSIVVG